MNYIIDIDNDENDEFELDSNNVGIVNVYDKNGYKITSDTKVQIFLSKNALLGLGTELIRLAHHFKEGKHYHITPADNETLCQRLGIFLAPDSSELIISCSDNKKIDEYIK